MQLIGRSVVVGSGGMRHVMPGGINGMETVLEPIPEKHPAIKGIERLGIDW